MIDVEKIERKRLSKGMNKKDLAESAGINPLSYTRIVEGEVSRPHASTVKAICDALGLTTEEVYVGAEETHVA